MNAAESPKYVNGKWVIVRSIPGAGTFVTIALTDREVDEIQKGSHA